MAAAGSSFIEEVVLQPRAGIAWAGLGNSTTEYINDGNGLNWSDPKTTWGNDIVGTTTIGLTGGRSALVKDADSCKDTQWAWGHTVSGDAKNHRYACIDPVPALCSMPTGWNGTSVPVPGSVGLNGALSSAKFNDKCTTIAGDDNGAHPGGESATYMSACPLTCRYDASKFTTLDAVADYEKMYGKYPTVSAAACPPGKFRGDPAGWRACVGAVNSDGYVPQTGTAGSTAEGIFTPNYNVVMENFCSQVSRDCPVEPISRVQSTWNKNPAPFHRPICSYLHSVGPEGEKCRAWEAAWGGYKSKVADRVGSIFCSQHPEAYECSCYSRDSEESPYFAVWKAFRDANASSVAGSSPACFYKPCADSTNYIVPSSVFQPLQDSGTGTLYGFNCGDTICGAVIDSGSNGATNVSDNNVVIQCGGASGAEGGKQGDDPPPTTCDVTADPPASASAPAPAPAPAAAFGSGGKKDDKQEKKEQKKEDKGKDKGEGGGGDGSGSSSSKTLTWLHGNWRGLIVLTSGLVAASIAMGLYFNGGSGMLIAAAAVASIAAVIVGGLMLGGIIGGGGKKDPDTPPPVTGCQSNADCSFGAECEKSSGKCYCGNVNTHCDPTSDTPYCSITSKTCVACAMDGHCSGSSGDGMNTVCTAAGTCGGCSSAPDKVQCAPGSTCSATADKCVTGACTADADCPVGMTCNADGACTGRVGMTYQVGRLDTAALPASYAVSSAPADDAPSCQRRCYDSPFCSTYQYIAAGTAGENGGGTCSLYAGNRASLVSEFMVPPPSDAASPPITGDRGLVNPLPIRSRGTQYALSYVNKAASSKGVSSAAAPPPPSPADGTDPLSPATGGFTTQFYPDTTFGIPTSLVFDDATRYDAHNPGPYATMAECVAALDIDLTATTPNTSLHSNAGSGGGSPLIKNTTTFITWSPGSSSAPAQCRRASLAASELDAPGADVPFPQTTLGASTTVYTWEEEKGEAK